MSPTPEAADARAAALHGFAVWVGALRGLLAPRHQRQELTPDASSAALARALDEAFQAAIAAGYSRAMAVGMLRQVLRPTDEADVAQLAAAWTHLELLSARELGAEGMPT